MLPTAASQDPRCNQSQMSEGKQSTIDFMRKTRFAYQKSTFALIPAHFPAGFAEIFSLGYKNGGKLNCFN